MNTITEIKVRETALLYARYDFEREGPYVLIDDKKVIERAEIYTNFLLGSEAEKVAIYE